MESSGGTEHREQRLEAALQAIYELDPELTQDGFKRDDLCPYADEVSELAREALDIRPPWAP